MGLPIPRSGSTPHKSETVMGGSCGGLRPSEVVHLTIPDPAEQAPLVARSVTPPSPSGRGGTTLLRQRAPRSCTVFVMTPPNEHTSEGGRDDRGVPYHAESTLSSAQVLKFDDSFFCLLRQYHIGRPMRKRPSRDALLQSAAHTLAHGPLWQQP